MKVSIVILVTTLLMGFGCNNESGGLPGRTPVTPDPMDYQAAIVPAGGLFYTELGFSYDTQVNRTWVEPSANVACVEVHIDDRIVSVSLYSDGALRETIEGSTFPPIDIPSDMEPWSLLVLPYLDALQQVTHERVSEDPVVLVVEPYNPETGNTLSSRVELHAETLFPILHETGQRDSSGDLRVATTFYQNSRIIDGTLDVNSRGRCEIK